MGPLLILNSTLLGVGLAMDAFSVSLANGLHEPDMPRSRAVRVAGLFAAFQMGMPLVGYLCVRTAARFSENFERVIPWIALILLVVIGGKMILEALRGDGRAAAKPLRGRTLFIMGLATSVDAFSVGFTIASHPFAHALLEAAIIGLVTFFICMLGLYLGRRIGTRAGRWASVAGGILLIAIGIEIFLTGRFL